MTRKDRPKTSRGIYPQEASRLFPQRPREAQQLEVASKPEGRGLKTKE